MRQICVLIISCLSVLLAACDYVAVQSASKKQAAPSRSETAVKADILFWDALHHGKYEEIGHALEGLTAAYLNMPTDATTAAHIGWLHIWRVSERARLPSVPATITDDAVLARKYFQEAVALDPSDARYLGFLAGATLAEGTIHKDEKLVREGYYLLLDSIKAWPEFNLFTAGYVMSRLPHDSPRFQEGLKWEWQNLDVCVQEQVNRQTADFSKYMSMATTEGKKRVCWNSWIAPHNFEGFFLNMGDMLVKSGDWQTAQKAYANAKLSPDYATWKFREVLEDRIVNARSHVDVFRDPQSPNSKAPVRMMINSEFACMACHQR
jgi:hypothetical protein